ncbi:phage tail assembly chaperone [Sphingopyxis yananensis]|uniref:phage tail assembly chaperone n=1 Tax=Sphingopyxis yananensis TaxID=2886687 RepID=UPI001D126E2F|nr:phage tail assembly chaperone [Sphingopyxis yananensis]MCC2601706.1 phage tail assembly chaperone [Sphingopyxis yananensis]
MTTGGRTESETGRFGPAARKLLGVMARLCGWRPDEFWRATPEDTAAVLAGWMEPMGRIEAGGGCDAGQLAAMMERFPDG